MSKKQKIQNIYRLTPMQEGMLFHSLAHGQSGAYFEQRVFTISGAVERDILEQAFQWLVQRYDILRTIFRHQNVKEPLQVVMAQRAFTLRFDDISHMEPEEQETFIETFASDERKTGFDLSKDLLVRGSLFKTGGESFTLIWSYHHILMDAWCWGILFKDLIHAYRCLKKQVPINLKPVPSYSLYIKWLEKRNKERGLEFWKDYLDDYDAMASLPHSNSPQLQESYQLDELFFKLPADDRDRFDALAKETKVTQNILFQTIWGLLLQKYNDMDDAVFGAVVSGRPPDIPGVEDMVGLFINTVPVRVKREPGMTFADLLAKMGGATAKAREFEFVPLPLIQAQTTRKTHLMDHIMGFQNYPGLGEVQGEKPDDDLGFRLTDMKIHEQTNYNFNIMFIPGSDATIKFSYNQNVYDDFCVKQVERHLLNIIHQVVNEPAVPIDNIQLITPEERRDIIESFNDPETDSGTDETIERMFVRQAEQTPDRIAVSSPIDIERIQEDPNLLGNTIFSAGDHWISREITGSNSSGEFFLLKTPRHHALLANQNLLELLLQFDGEKRLGDVLEQLKVQNIQFLYCPFKANDLLEVTYDVKSGATILSSSDLPAMHRMFKELYDYFLIKPVGYREETLPTEPLDIGRFESNSTLNPVAPEKLLLGIHQPIETGGALLLGDTPGQPSVGLFYLASYLKRNGIPAYALAYDPTDSEESFKANLELLIQSVQPKVIAVSLKWFLYIARVTRNCAIIKRLAPDAIVVVGGNTASYYWQELIKEECIDVIVRGDGEEPLLRICRQADLSSIPNIVYRNRGQAMENPFTYRQDKANGGDVYLSHLDEVMLGRQATKLGSFFIHTHKGCRMNCCFCGGCSTAQTQTFNRGDVLQRDPGMVATDIKAAMPHATTFQFDFERAGEGLLPYCREIFNGLDLTRHFCIVATLLPPDEELMRFFSETFNYVYFDIDITTFSERHRRALEEAALVKPQPTDEQIIEVMKQCDTLANAEVRVNLITGLPLFNEGDARESEQLFARLTQSRSSFFELHWARLHAQPGAPIIEKAQTLGMHPYAKTFADFLDYSRKNFSPGKQDPTFETFQYPYIYYAHQKLNSQTTRFYTDINRKMQQYLLEQRYNQHLNRSLSYSQLNRKSGQLAHTLKEKGIGRGDIVAILTENSIATIVAIMAVLKTGASYLPIDPQYPDGRVKYMIEDSNASLLLTTGTLISVKTFACDVLDIEDPESYHQEPLAGMDAGKPEDSVYCIYTSGTSGRSKGVSVTHANLANYVNWFSHEAGLGREDNGMLASSYAFDLGYTALYPSLLNGAGLHIPPKEIYLAPSRLLDYMAWNRISFIKMTPSLFTTIVNHPKFSHHQLPALRFVAVGGEAIIGDDIKTAYLRHQTLRLINHYGPTEATIGCVFYRIQREEAEAFAHTPVIGRAIDNNVAYIMDRQRNPMPVGTAGELCVGGAGIADGYLNRPELTEEKFFISPFDKNNRVYATGDLARFLPNGSIEFLGRVDQQVKIRGYRVETGEIEALLRRHHGVEDSVVVPVKNENNEQFLCAYIVPSNGRTSGNNGEHTVKREEWLEKVKRHAARTAPNEESSFIHWFLRKLEAKDRDARSIVEGESDRVAAWIHNNFDDRFRLSDEERTRYKRQILLTGWGEGKQELLKSKTVFVAGAGGGASPTIMQLALAGVGTIRVCDFDVVELSNLNRQFLHDESRIGVNKALSAQMTVKKINPHVRVIPITEKLTADNVFDIVGDADVIFDMFDGQDSKFLLSECAVAKGIPHIIAAMIDINGYASIFKSPETPCFHCVFDKKKLESIISGIKHQTGDYEKNPLPVIATSLFMSTGFAVNEAVKYMLDLGKPAFGKFMLFNQRGSGSLASSDSYQAMTYTFSDHFKETCNRQGFDWAQGWREQFLEELDIEPDPNCPCCGSEGHHLDAPETVVLQPGEKEAANPGEPSAKRVAALASDTRMIAACSMGCLKAGKVCVILNPQDDEKLLIKSLSRSGVRLLLTDKNNMEFALKIRDRVNDRIKIAAIEEIDGGGEKINCKEEWAGDWPALLILDHDSEDREIVLNHKEVIAAIQYAGEDLHHHSFNGLTAVLEGNDTIAGGDRDLRDYLNRHLPTYMVPGHFVSIDQIPLTPNGKLDKRLLPDPLTGDGAQEYVPPRNELEETIASIGAEVLGLEKIGINENFFEYGLDSIKAIQISSRLLTRKYKLEINDILAQPTVACLAERAKSTEKTIDRGPVAGAVKLTPYQTKLATMTADARSRHIQAVLVEDDKEIDHQVLRQALQRLTTHHDALRMVFAEDNGRVTQTNRGLDNTLFELNISDSPVTIDRDFGPMNLPDGPLLRVSLSNNPKDRAMLIEVHGLIMDPSSWTLLLRDLFSLYSDLANGISSQLPSAGGSFMEWSDELWKLADTPKVANQRDYWLGTGELDVASPIFSNDGDTNVHRVSIELETDQTRAIRRDVHKAFNTEPLDILLAAFAIALHNWSGNAAFRIVVEEGARADIVESFDTRNICGCFSTHYPLVLDLQERQDPERALIYTKETLRAVPNRGVGFGLLDLKTDCHIGFAYYGEFSEPDTDENLFRVTEFRLPKASYPLTASAVMVDGRLRIFFDFSNNHVSKDRVEKLAGHFREALLDIADRCLGKDESVRTASDFSATDMDQEELDDIFDYLG